MATILGQQMASLAGTAIKMVAAALAVSNEPTSWNVMEWPKVPSRRTSAHQLASSRRNSVNQMSPASRKTSVIQQQILQTYTLDAVSWHWEASDCWMVIYDKVYDLTDFLSNHPGGYEVLLEHGGRDATAAFRGVGHSKQALVSMEQYCIGILVESERMYDNSTNYAS